MTWKPVRPVYPIAPEDDKPSASTGVSGGADMHTTEYRDAPSLEDALS